MKLDTVAHLMEFIASSGLLLLIWKANRLINAVWDALKTAPPHLHVGKRIFYPPPFKKPQIATELDNGEPIKG